MTAKASAQPAASASPGPWTLAQNQVLSLSVWGSALLVVAIGFIVTAIVRSRAGADQKPITDKDLEAERIFYGFWLIIAGLVLTLAVVVVTVTRFVPTGGTIADIIAVITSVTGVIGTLTAAFFGIQAAGAGRSQAMSALDQQLRSQAGAAGSGGIKLEPPHGPHAGNTRVSITGNGFSGAMAANFGATPGVNFEFVNDGLVRVTSPPMPLDRTTLKNKSDVEVALIFPSAPNRDVGTFYYYTIELSGDGTTVNIYGTGLKGAVAVQVGETDPIEIETGSENKVQFEESKIAEAARGADVEVAVLFAADAPTKRSVIGRYRFPPLPEPKPEHP